MIAALTDLKISTQEIRSVLQEIVASTTPTTLSDVKIQRSNQLICNAVPVMLSGYLETFLRDCSKRFMIKVEAKGLAFAALPDAMRACHYNNGGWLLHKLMENRVSWVTCTPEDFLARLASAVTKNPTMPVWEAFGDTDQNPNGKVVKQFLEDFGIDGPAAKVDAKAAGGGRKWGDFMAGLKLLISTRNACAHSGKPTTTLLPSGLIDDCDLLDELGLRITEVLEDHLATM